MAAEPIYLYSKERTWGPACYGPGSAESKYQKGDSRRRYLQSTKGN